MTASLMHDSLNDRLTWSLSIREDSHREYTVQWLCKTTDEDDGPETVANIIELPNVGDPWQFGNDSDTWARNTPYMKVSPHQHKPGETVQFWVVEMKYSTDWNERCQTGRIEDPLAEPAKISGSFVKYTQEVAKAYESTGDVGNTSNLKALKSSSHEPLRGPQVEFDHNRPSVVISVNLATLDLSLVSQMVDTVNQFTMWNLPARTIKLSNVSWARRFYGDDYCEAFYELTYEFDIDFSTFDREVLDEGTKALGHWIPGEGAGKGTWKKEGDPNNFEDFERYRDKTGEITHVLLDGTGGPIGDPDSPVYKTVVYYEQSNFAELGIDTQNL